MNTDEFVNQLIKYNGNEIRYDKNGNMIYGSLDGEMTEFEYDSRNRLMEGDIKYLNVEEYLKSLG